MKKLILATASLLFASSVFAGDTAIHKEYAPTLADAQRVTNNINNKRQSIRNCPGRGLAKVYSVTFPSGQSARVDRFGTLEMQFPIADVQGLTTFKVECRSGAGDR